MSITSFDHFIETLESVPNELQRNFNLMADLDTRAGELVRRINECVQEYRKSNRKETRIAIFKESMDLFDKARSYADDKVDLAMQTYDLVDKHIRRLEGLSGTQAINEATPGPIDKKQTVDMPLDPNEPKYCTCHQVSYGEMIACDNKDCPIEWFHFSCVELKSKPKGRWYCPECFNINKKRKHRRHKTQ